MNKRYELQTNPPNDPLPEPEVPSPIPHPEPDPYPVTDPVPAPDPNPPSFPTPPEPVPQFPPDVTF